MERALAPRALPGHRRRKSLAEVKPEEEGFLEITRQLTKVINEMQRDLNEAKYSRARVESSHAPAIHTAGGAQPYLGGDDDQLAFSAPATLPAGMARLDAHPVSVPVRCARIAGRPAHSQHQPH